MSTVKMVKKDALITIKIGTEYLQRFQQLLSNLASQQSPEELDTFRDLIAKGDTEFPEQWMENLYVISSFIHNIETEATAQGHTYEQSIDTTSTE